MTRIQKRALDIVRDRPGIATADLGNAIWGRDPRYPGKHAPSAGLALAALRKEGLVTSSVDGKGRTLSYPLEVRQ